MSDTTIKPKREDMKRETRDKVIRAAQALFENKGYHAAELREIATAAGLSTGGIFSNFATKAEVYEAVYGHPPISPEEGRQLRERVAELEARAA